MKSQISALIVLLVTAQWCIAQKKQLGFPEIFGNTPVQITKTLPTIEWIDDEHYASTTTLNGKTTTVAVDVKTGYSVPYRISSAASTPSVNLPTEGKNEARSPDGKWVAYTSGNNFFAKEISSGREIQFTQDGSDDVYNGTPAWVYYEEMFGRSRQAFWWSPDSKHIAFIRFDESQVPLYTIFNPQGKYGSVGKCHYPQAGDKNPQVKLGIVSVTDPHIVWADFNEKDDQYFGPPFWLPGGSELWAQWISRNQHALKIFSIDIVNGAKKKIYEEAQNTWVIAKYDIMFLEKSKQFIINSDKEGWDHLYLYNMNGELVNQITTGDFAVSNVLHTDEKNRIIYFLSSKENGARMDLYKIGFDGKGLTRLTFGDYSHDNLLLSPHLKYFITTYSNISTPPKMALVDMKGKRVRDIADSRGEEFEKYELAKIETHIVKTKDGLYELPVQLTYPLQFDPRKKYPVWIEVYGGPGLGTFHDRWSGDLRSQWWAKEGMIQVTMDYRSSGHFGKKGMNFIYGQMGKYEISDFIDCASWIRSQPFVDTTKICFTGFSFGGFMTCLALTYGAGIFTHGIAYYPVTDWTLYDSYYSERYMGLPQDNAPGYKTNSPIYYADRYKGLLRIVHGGMDDNAHLQNTLQFVRRLQELDKHFEMMIYPGERHGRGNNWSEADKKQSHNEDYKFLYDNLLDKSMPDIFWK